MIYGMSSAVSARDTASSTTLAFEITDVRPQAARTAYSIGNVQNFNRVTRTEYRNFISYLLQIMDLSLPSIATSLTKQSHSRPKYSVSP